MTFNSWYFQDVRRGWQWLHKPTRDDQHHRNHGWARRWRKGESWKSFPPDYIWYWGWILWVNHFSSWCQYFGLTHPLAWPFIARITQLTHFLDRIIAFFEYQSTLGKFSSKSTQIHCIKSKIKIYFTLRWGCTFGPPKSWLVFFRLLGLKRGVLIQAIFNLCFVLVMFSINLRCYFDIVSSFGT